MKYSNYSWPWALVCVICLAILDTPDARASLELSWSVRQGLVGEWGIRGEEVFIVGRYLGVYDYATGHELRRKKLQQDYGNTTLGQISPEVIITPSYLIFAWYDFATEEGKIFCYDPNSLTLKWEHGVKWSWNLRMTRPSFSVVVDENAVYALALGKEGSNLFKLNLIDGATIWSGTIEKYVKGVRLVFHDGKLLVRSVVLPGAQDSYGYFQAIDHQTGNSRWRVKIEGKSLADDDQPLISGHRAYITSEKSTPGDAHFYIIDLNQGAVIKHETHHHLRAPFAEEKGLIFFGGSRPAALDLERGGLLWQSVLQEPGLNITASGVFDPAYEQIYLGDSQRDLYVLSAKTGSVLEKVDIKGYWRGDVFSPLKSFFGSYGVRKIVLTRNLLFVGTVDSSLFVFSRPGAR